jgi:hypothetical protein
MRERARVNGFSIIGDPVDLRTRSSDPEYFDNFIWQTFPGLHDSYKFERIIDEGGPRPAVLYPRKCYHDRIWSTYYGGKVPTFTVNTYPGSPTWTISMAAPSGFLDSLDCTRGLTVPDSVEKSAQSFIDSSIGRLRKQVPTNASVPNILFELGDLKSLATGVEKLRSYGPKSIRDLQRGIRRRKVNLGRTTSDHWLAYHFGIKPFITDVFEFALNHDSVNKRLGHLERTNGRWMPFEFGKVFKGVFPVEELYGGGWSFGTYNTVYKTRYSLAVKCGGKLRHTIESLHDPARRFLAYAAGYGFSRPLTAIYDAIPFSFLLDYVSNVGDVIDTYAEVPTFEGEFEIGNMWSTRKVETLAEMDLRWFGPSGWPLAERIDSNPKSYQDTRKVSFSRQPGIPTNNGIMFDTTVSNGQFYNLLALLGAR